MNASEQVRHTWKMLEACQINEMLPVIVHSAFRRFSHAGFEIENVLRALIDYSRKSTLLMPTMSWRFVNTLNPYFSELNTPSNTGAMTEVFRLNYAKKRSLHPTHSVAGFGADLDYFLGSHHLDSTPCGAGSPFSRLIESDGQILLMGIGMDCCTMIHQIEEQEHIDTYLKPVVETATYASEDRSGRKLDVQVRHHKLLPRNYWQFQDALASSGELRSTRMGAPVCNGFAVRSLQDIVANALSKNPCAIISNGGRPYRMM